MPQFEPFTLNLQWNSTVIIIAFTIFLLGSYTLPTIIKTTLARYRIFAK